ncbi:box C/D snoRNA protein 1 [Drosophila novamexicana]|uniref:box C/D snoRNA protein 1 n=1 Tax=Drosophila novamexicana TaxID=47314 RepID=UPI0011E60820|nr:box C/D snoRNA protein 1 [Drosophila novamexicana]
MTETNSQAARPSRLGNCEVCASQAARYACPKCEVKTCCVACVQIHKRELNCDGKRDRTKFMPISAMTEREFMSDYCFLEECTRYTEDRKRDQIKRYTQQQRQLPLPQHRLRMAAQERGTRLQLLLPNFSRHKENTTYLNWKQRRIYWHIEWLFVHATASSVTRLVDKHCDEERTLADLLSKYLDLLQAEAVEQRKLLQHHQTAGIGQLSLWLRAEGVQRSGQRCYRLAAHQTLRANLAGKTIVEFPAIYISYEARPPAGYDLIDSDEEVEAAKSNNKRSPQPQDPEAKPAAKRSKAAAKSTQQSELHGIYGLAGSFGADDNSCSSSSSDQEAQPN